jgi:hypothetical protein
MHVYTLLLLLYISKMYVFYYFTDNISSRL